MREPTRRALDKLEGQGAPNVPQRPDVRKDRTAPPGQAAEIRLGKRLRDKIQDARQ